MPSRVDSETFIMVIEALTIRQHRAVSGNTKHKPEETRHARVEFQHLLAHRAGCDGHVDALPATADSEVAPETIRHGLVALESQDCRHVSAVDTNCGVARKGDRPRRAQRGSCRMNAGSLVDRRVKSVRGDRDDSSTQPAALHFLLRTTS
jgi:hypothetical protein